MQDSFTLPADPAWYTRCMAAIRRVKFHQLRNVKPGSTFEMHPGLNLLLGRNGTGKTTLLQWMADFLSGNMDAWRTSRTTLSS